MASANDMGKTEIAASSVALIDRLLQQRLVQSAVFANTLINRSADAVQGAKSVAFIRRDSFTAAAKAENTAATKQKLTLTADTIALDQHYQVVAMLEDVARLQAGANDLESAIFTEINQAFIDNLEGALYTALAAASSSAPDHIIAFDSGTTLQEADILEAAKLLDIQKVPYVDRFLAIHPNQMEDLRALARFTEADKMPGTLALMNGQIGMVHGFNVMMTVNCTADTVLAYHRSAVGYAIQQGIQLRADRANAEEFGTDYSGLITYGVKTLDSGVRQVLINATGS